MARHLLDDLRSSRNDVATGQVCLENIRLHADAADDDFRLMPGLVEDLARARDHLYRITADILEPTVEDGDVTCARIGGEHALFLGEDAGAVHLDALLREGVDRLE